MSDKLAMSDKREKGIAVISEMMGPEFAQQMIAVSESGGFCADVAGMALDHAFGSVWSRPGLERKQRSLVTIAVLVASGQILEFKTHVKIGIANGLTALELQEALIQTIPYLGYPAFASASSAAIEVLRELGLDTQTKTSEERGLL